MKKENNSEHVPIEFFQHPNDFSKRKNTFFFKITNQTEFLIIKHIEKTTCETLSRINNKKKFRSFII